MDDVVDVGLGVPLLVRQGLTFHSSWFDCDCVFFYFIIVLADDIKKTRVYPVLGISSQRWQL